MEEWKQIFFALLHHLKRACLLVLGGLLVCAAALMLAGGLMVWIGTNQWPRAEGSMTKFETRPSRSSPAKIQLVLGYEYTVSNRKFIGEAFSPLVTDSEVSRTTAARIQREFPVDGPVDVIYDPANPSRSFLEPPDLFWDVLLHPIAVGCLAAWMLYLFIQTRRRSIPDEVATQADCRFVDGPTSTPVFGSVMDHDHVILHGTASYSSTGGLLAGWPRCHIALVASPNRFYVVPGPYTKRGFACSLLTLALETSLSRVWLPAIHGMVFLGELWRRRSNWKLVRARRIDRLGSGGSVKSVSIDEALVYGFDQQSRRLWFRLPEKQVDEFIELDKEQIPRVAGFIGFIGLMQKGEPEPTTSPHDQGRSLRTLFSPLPLAGSVPRRPDWGDSR